MGQFPQANIASGTEEQLTSRSPQGDQAEHSRHSTPDESPEAEASVMRCHEGSRQGKTVSDESGNDGMRVTEEHLDQIRGGAVGRGIEQDNQQTTEAKINRA